MAHPTGKALILLGDGLGDRPVADLGGKTPLEAAQTPNLDRLAALGECGLMDPIRPGVPAGSDTAHLSMLGYNPYESYTGRGPLEALGVGMDVRRGDLAFRCNFATVEPQPDGSLLIVDRRAGRIAEGTAELAAAVNALPPMDGVQFILRESIEHRAALLMRGDGLDACVSDADPHAEGAAVAVVEGRTEAAQRTAGTLNAWVRKTYEALDEHPVNVQRRAAGLKPANIILPRGCGVAPHLKPFSEQWGVRGALVVEVGLIKGLGRYLDMTVADVPGATGGYDTDEIALAKATLEALHEHEFVLCNLKSPDLAGHDGNAEAKVRCCAQLDRLVGHVLDHVDLEATAIAVAGDHSTPVSVRDHSGDPLPLAIAGQGVRTDAVAAFGERPCATGGLGRIVGHDLLSVLMNLIGAAEKYGA